MICRTTTMVRMSKSSLRQPAHDDVAALIRQYRKQCGFYLFLTDLTGRICAGQPGCTGCRQQKDCLALRRRIIAEAQRWGAPAIDLCPHGWLVWGVPAMTNQQVTGGLMATAPARAMEKVRPAADSLLKMAEESNLTNGALLELRRTEAERERRKAEAIHSVKGADFDAIRSVYLQEEPALIAAIKKGERSAARAIINCVLVGIYFLGRARRELLKSLILELVVMMCRAAVEAGAEPAELFGGHYRVLAELAQIHDDEALTRWLTDMLERVMDAIHDHRRYPNEVLLGKALNYMQENLAENLSRNAVARAAGLSPSHFSHLMRAKLNRSFTEALTQYRVDRAAQLLARTPDSLAAIALACGFPDQSYFSKVFKKTMGRTPLAYRRLSGSPPPGHLPP
jgi:AraC-like DNA-binding protein